MLQYAGHTNFILTSLVKEYEKTYFDGDVVVSIDALRQTWRDPVADIDTKVFTDKKRAEEALEEMKLSTIRVMRVDSEHWGENIQNCYIANTINKAKKFIIHHETKKIPIDIIEIGTIEQEYREDGGSIDDFMQWLKATNRNYKIKTIYFASESQQVFEKIKPKREN